MSQRSEITKLLFILRESGIVKDFDAFLNIDVSILCDDELKSLLKDFGCERVIDLFQSVPNINSDIRSLKQRIKDAAEEVFG